MSMTQIGFCQLCRLYSWAIESFTLATSQSSDDDRFFTFENAQKIGYESTDHQYLTATDKLLCAFSGTKFTIK